MRVAIYARVSTAAQAEEGYSLGAQVEDCTRYAKAKLHAEVIHEFVDDGYSGAFLERPALEKLRQELAFKAYDAVVCYDADRLARGLTTQLLITDEIEKNCKLYFCNMDYQRTPEGQLFYQIKGAFSGYEREKIKQRSMRGKLAKLKQGKPIQDYRIYGYRYVNENYVIEPSEAEIVKLIYSTYLSSEVGGTEGVANMLNSRGIPSPAGAVWHSTSVRNVLVREDYTGIHLANRIAWQKVSAHKIKRSEKPQQDWLPIEMPQIISREDYIQAQDKLKKGKMYRLANEPYFVQGLAYCGVCGKPMSTSKRGQYTYLRCNSAAYLKHGAKTCGARVINLNIINEAFWDLFSKLCRTEANLSAYMKKKRTAERSDDTTQMQAELKRITKEKQTLLDWWHSGIVSEIDVKAKLKRLTMQQNTLQEKIKSTAASKESKLTVDKIVSLVRHAPSSFADRQSVVRTVVERVNITRVDKGKRPADVKLEMDIFFK